MAASTRTTSTDIRRGQRPSTRQSVSGLENRCGGNLTVGSNPTLSASIPRLVSERAYWRGDRVAEGARLEIVCVREGTEGSNPSLSAGH